MFQIYNYKSTN